MSQTTGNLAVKLITQLPAPAARRATLSSFSSFFYGREPLMRTVPGDFWQRDCSAKPRNRLFLPFLSAETPPRSAVISCVGSSWRPTPLRWDNSPPKRNWHRFPRSLRIHLRDGELTRSCSRRLLVCSINKSCIPVLPRCILVFCDWNSTRFPFYRIMDGRRTFSVHVSRASIFAFSFCRVRGVYFCNSLRGIS